MSLVAVASTDVEFRMKGREKCEVAVGLRTFSLTADPDVLESLTGVILQVVPRLRRSASIGEQLSAAEAERLAPFVGRLRDMGILLFPRNGVVITDEPGRRLYSYIYRRSNEPDQVYSGIRAKRIHVSGLEPVVDVWCPLLEQQGLTADRLEPGDDAELTIVIARDKAALAAANRVQCADRSAWLPVLFGTQRVRIGPWVWVGESGCLRCHTPADSVAEPTRAEGAAAGWVTLQSASLHWTGGLVAHLALRALLPMGAEHPWGRVTDVDVATGEQTSVTTWRDPFCVDCAEAAPTPREWVTF